MPEVNNYEFYGYNKFLEKDTSLLANFRDIQNYDTQNTDDQGNTIEGGVGGGINDEGEYEAPVNPDDFTGGDISQPLNVIQNYIQSANFVTGSVGWQINSKGDAEFNDVTIRGTIYATLGEIGGWNINATTIYSDSNEIILDSANTKITVGTSNPITIDGANKKIESDNYVSGYDGSGFHLSEDLLEVANIACRGLIRTSCFQKDVISTVGGNLMVLDGDVLDVDMTASDTSSLTIKGTTSFSNGDILRIKTGEPGVLGDDEWFEVIAILSAPEYTVTRDKKGDYAANTNPAWKKGATVVNYGQSGDGGIYQTASEANAPYLEVFTHAGSPWLTAGAGCLTTRLRIGNLKGFLSEGSDVYGVAVGETTKYLKYDPTNGMRLRGKVTIGDVLEFDPTSYGGYVKFQESAVDKVVEYWDVANNYWGIYPSFGGYAYASISLRQSDSRLAFGCPGNSPYIQMAFTTKKIMFHCDETTDTEDFSIEPGKIILARDYLDVG